MRTRTHIIKLRSWFPGGDPIATAVAQLSILREDCFLELQGLRFYGNDFLQGNSKDAGLGPLDANSPFWRHSYFFRNFLRTLIEIRKVAESVHLKYNKELSKECDSFQNALKKLRSELALTPTDFAKIKQIRNNLGGHVLPKGVQAALNKMDIDKTGIFQDGEIRGKIHYKFAAQIVLSVMFPDVSEENLLEEFKALLQNTAKLVFILGSIDEVLKCYIQGRKLLQ